MSDTYVHPWDNKWDMLNNFYWQVYTHMFAGQKVTLAPVFLPSQTSSEDSFRAVKHVPI